MSATTADIQQTDWSQYELRKHKLTPGRVILYVFLTLMALLWLLPMLLALYNSFREFGYTLEHGYVSFGGFTLDNYPNAWRRGGFSMSFGNSAIITIVAVIVTLALSSSMAFVLARVKMRFNFTLLAIFVAANLLPPQSLLSPIYRIFRSMPLPQWLSESGSLLDTHASVILINVAFQTGFCTFVLRNYMIGLPAAMYEAAEIDGASLWRQFYGITLPLIRPALAALATLQVAWIYNEFFWATVLLQSGDKMPVTSSLNNLKGTFFTDANLLSAGSIIAALPVLLIFFVLQKQFVSGLTLGATKD
ncbi:carbohydrate ABC transporter permease [Propioniciclava sinopodophylli]|uniref:carbohydrate ABC transporter permease n=1 Tax=Propioniciclava sinopodophylli TaxID=1837344 RepID=UPI0024922849|nr:carbohydrate ABC transporter permease [Propioniciclava sinopodophylli]